VLFSFDDAKREDLVTLAFHFWSFSVAFVAVMHTFYGPIRRGANISFCQVLNESLPHLGAALAAHILGTAWAAYRVSSTETLRAEYMSLISGGACKGVDMLGDWWEVRKLHAVSGSRDTTSARKFSFPIRSRWSWSALWLYLQLGSCPSISTRGVYSHI
jgi:hypothetical protein